MTQDQIKAIAEEYARQNPPSTTDEILKREIAKLNAEQVFEPFLRFLNERYCIVEREKVEHEMIKANQNIDLFTLYPQVVSANEGVKRVLTKLFGTDIRKEEDI